MPKLLESALWYAKQNLSVIPVGQNKKALIPWAKYQKERATEAQIRSWWKEHPKANVGIVTGKISGITVIDIDSQAGREAIDELTPDSWLTPTAYSPSGGEHRWCKYAEGVGNSTRFLKDCDVRSEGGYVVSPPSQNGRGKYAWKEDLSIADTDISEIPNSILSLLLNNIYSKDHANHANERQPIPTGSVPLIPKGKRDDTIFHIANRLIKGSATQQELHEYLTLIALHCCEVPFPESEVNTKIESALNRVTHQRRSWKKEILAIIRQQTGNFTTTELQRETTTPTNANEKKAVSATLSRLVEEGYIERVKIGTYRILEKDLEFDDWINASGSPIEFKYPFGMERVVETFPGAIIVFAGETNAGKSCLTFETMKLNMRRYETCYHSSEIGVQKFKHRLSLSSDTSLQEFSKIKFKDGLTLENAPGRARKDWLNVFDYLEPTDGEYFKIPSIMRDIHHNIGDGVALKKKKKNKGVDWGNGGQQTMAKASLYCNLEVDFPGNKLIVKKCKEFSGETNPKDWMVGYKIVKGINLIPSGIFGPEGVASWRE